MMEIISSYVNEIKPMGRKITGVQLRAARALLRWSALDLAAASKVGVATIRRAEVIDGEIPVTAANEAALRRTLEAAGVELIEENGGGVGVRLKKPLRKQPKLLARRVKR